MKNTQYADWVLIKKITVFTTPRKCKLIQQKIVPKRKVYVDNSWQMKLKTVQASMSSLKCLFNASQVFMIITIVQQK